MSHDATPTELLDTPAPDDAGGWDDQHDFAPLTRYLDDAPSMAADDWEYMGSNDNHAHYRSRALGARIALPKDSATGNDDTTPVPGDDSGEAMTWHLHQRKYRQELRAAAEAVDAAEWVAENAAAILPAVRHEQLLAAQAYQQELKRIAAVRETERRATIRDARRLAAAATHRAEYDDMAPGDTGRPPVTSMATMWEAIARDTPAPDDIIGTTVNIAPDGMSGHGRITWR